MGLQYDSCTLWTFAICTWSRGEEQMWNLYSQIWCWEVELIQSVLLRIMWDWRRQIERSRWRGTLVNLYGWKEFLNQIKYLYTVCLWKWPFRDFFFLKCLWELNNYSNSNPKKLLISKHTLFLLSVTWLYIIIIKLLYSSNLNEFGL